MGVKEWGGLEVRGQSIVLAGVCRGMGVGRSQSIGLEVVCRGMGRGEVR